MKGTVLVIALLFLATAVVNAQWGSYNPPQEGDPCHHYSTPCGVTQLVNETVQPCPSSQCSGSNVCITTRTYMRHYYSAFYRRVCRQRYSWFGYREVCRMECEVSNSCNVTKNKTRTEHHCCKGFTTNNTHHGLYNRYWLRESHRYLKRYGCPVVVHNSTYDCLIELGLTEFASHFSDSLKAQVGNDSAKRPKFTIFAPPNEIVLRAQLGNLSESERDIKIRSHIVKKNLPSNCLFNGMKKKSLADGRFIHVSESYENSNMWSTRNTNTYINCHRLIAPDACLAENGRVHVIQGVVCSSDRTIAQIIETMPRFSLIASLFRRANLTSVLNRTHGYPLTLFAPSNDAFQRGSEQLRIDLVRCLNNLNTTQLRHYLKYHYTCDAECSSVLVTKTELQTESCKWVRSRRRWWRGYRMCERLTINVNDEGIEIGTTGSAISQADIPASNGIIHELTLPLVNPSLNLTELCSGFTLNPSSTPFPTPSSTPSRPSPSSTPSPIVTPTMTIN